jgi:hypothetical protein
MMIGLLGISLTAVLAAEANAQISGWAGTGFSEFRFEVDLKKVKNPTKIPSVLVVNGTLNSIECFCLNPRNRDVFPGRPAVQEVSAAEEVPEEPPKPGQVTVTLHFDLDRYEDLAWKPGFNPIHGSCAADDITLRMKWYRCTGDPVDPDPCFDANGPTVDLIIDQADTECTLDPVVREANHIPKPGQEFYCPEIFLP